MDRRKKGEYIGALGALLVHVAVIALLILVSFTAFDFYMIHAFILIYNRKGVPKNETPFLS